MTIHEIEEKTGMTRANVRYYEKEGLLSPLRGSNNYRDYSADDLAALKKIQLLRQLRVPVADIVRLQKGELSLDTVLASQGAALERESRELSDAAQLCREMWNAHISYDSLNAEEWLNRSPAPETVSAQEWKSDDVLFTAPHPWRRFLAHDLDRLLAGLVLLIVECLVLRLPMDGEVNVFSRWLTGLLIAFFEGIVEALLLCTIGTTPGKWIFGLRVRGRDGKKLSFPQAAFRAFQRFIFGEACGVPLLGLWRYWVSYKACVNEEVLPWDEEVAYSCSPHRRRHFLCVPTGVLCITAMIFAAAQSLLPVHQGPLTKEEFIENCETFARQHLGYSGRYLDETLIWREPEDPVLFIIDLSPAAEDFKKSPYELTLDSDGHITAVWVEYESHKDAGWISPFSNTVSILQSSYVMAANHANLFSMLRAEDLWENRNWMENGSFTDGCVKVTVEMEQQGYDLLTGENVLVRSESLDSYREEPYFRWSITLELIENDT